MARFGPKPRPIIDRFLEKVRRSEGAAGCLEWTGRGDKNGYGKMLVGRKRMGAHRVAYELAFGPIPPGAFICHRCDNPGCVEPDHLYAGNAATNVQDFLDRRLHLFRGKMRKAAMDRVARESDATKQSRAEKVSAASKKLWASRTPDERSEVGLKAHRSMTPEMKRERGRKISASLSATLRAMTPEQRAERARKTKAGRKGGR